MTQVEYEDSQKNPHFYKSFIQILQPKNIDSFSHLFRKVKLLTCYVGSMDI